MGKLSVPPNWAGPVRA
ncbi:hypothetical protein ABLN97_00620 [Mycobacterium tuberculosis]